MAAKRLPVTIRKQATNNVTAVHGLVSPFGRVTAPDGVNLKSAKDDVYSLLKLKWRFEADRNPSPSCCLIQ